MIECEICFTEYQEDNLELHRETCVLLLVFRCSICNEDYVSREGLWNHLDLHEILDESKELHYQELKAKHKLYQCALCNDQRAYSEDFYRMHFNNVHENRIYQDLKPVLDINDLSEGSVSVKVEHKSSDDEHLRQTQEVQTTEACVGNDNRMIEEFPVDQGIDADSNIDEESTFSIAVLDRRKSLRSRFARDNRKNGFSGKASLIRNKLTCPESAVDPKNSQVSAIQDDQTISMILSQDDIKLEITVEETKLQHQENQISNKYSGSSFGTAMHPHGCESVSDKVPPEDDIASDNCNEQPTPQRMRYGSSVRNEAGDLVWPCPFCKLTFKKCFSRRSHVIRNHTEPKHKCSICERAFHSTTDLGRHAKRCALTLMSKHKSKKHLHGSESKGDEVPPEDDIVAEIRKEQPTRQRLWYGHSVRNEAGDLEWPCPICKLCFRRCENRRTHIIRCHMKPRYKCSICEKGFNFKGDHDRHEKWCSRTLFDEQNRKNIVLEENVSGVIWDDSAVRNEAGDLVWPCPICKVTLKTIGARRMHRIRYHTRPKFKCSICEKEFHFKANLIQHEKWCSHTSRSKLINE